MRSRRARLNTGQSIGQPGSCEHARLGVMTPRERETFPPVTLGQIRGHGCRNLLVYCESVWCNHSAVMNADALPDELPVRGPMSADGVHGLRPDRRRCAAGLVAAYDKAASLSLDLRPHAPARFLPRQRPTAQCATTAGSCCPTLAWNWVTQPLLSSVQGDQR